MRVVVDTNVYISALMFGGLPGDLLELILMGAFETLTSQALLDELGNKLRSKFRVSDRDAESIISKISSAAEVIPRETKLRVLAADPDDDRVLECAVDGCADVIISGDRHLLNLGDFRGIAIVRVREFLESIETDREG